MTTLLLSFFPRPEGGTEPVRRELIEASDWAVLFTLGTLFFLFGSFAVWAWLIWRRSTRPEPHIALLMELEDESATSRAADSDVERSTPRGETPEPESPWEKRADWWKKMDR